MNMSLVTFPEFTDNPTATWKVVFTVTEHLMTGVKAKKNKTSL